MNCPPIAWLVLVSLLTSRAEQSTNITALDDYRYCPLKPDQYAFEVLPGAGWDSLRNLEMGRILAINYSRCVITEDSGFLVPNDFIVHPAKQTRMDLASDVFDHFKDYTPLASESVTTSSRAHFAAAGSFSKEYREVKDAQINGGKGNAKIARVIMDHKFYSIMTQRAKPLQFTKEFLQSVDELANELIAEPIKSPSHGDYLAELMLRQYGTHYIYHMEAGASLAKVDVANKDSYSEGCAAQSFTQHFNISTDSTTHCSDLKKYQEDTHSSVITSLGGPPLSPETEMNAWRQDVENNLVAINRKGEFLDALFKKSSFPAYPASLLRGIQHRVREAIKRYFKSNSVKGCMDLHSSWFNQNANVDDRSSCSDLTHKYYFSGSFQKCEVLEWPRDGNQSVTDKDMASPCKTLQQENANGMGWSCGWSTVVTEILKRKRKFCQPNCDGGEMTSCEQICSTLLLTTFWCGSPDSTRYHVYFGGFHSRDDLIINPATQGYSCPAGFKSHRFTSATSIVCVSQLAGVWSVLSFGGMYSCTVGNPFVGGTMACPGGYSKHLAVIEDECEVYYCVGSQDLVSYESLIIRMPPFTNKPIPTRRRLRHDDLSLADVDLDTKSQWIMTNGAWRFTPNITIQDIEVDTDRMMIKRFFEST